MAVKYVKDFEFPSDFGFSRSANVRTSAVAAEGGPVDDGTYVSRHKRRAKRFAEGGPVNDQESGMDPVERQNYETLKASPKKWSDAEARDMATNPSGRLPPAQGQTQPKQKQKFADGGPLTPGAPLPPAPQSPGVMNPLGRGPVAQPLSGVMARPAGALSQMAVAPDIQEDMQNRPERPVFQQGETPDEARAAMQGYGGQMRDWASDLGSDARGLMQARGGGFPGAPTPFGQGPNTLFRPNPNPTPMPPTPAPMGQMPVIGAPPPPVGSPPTGLAKGGKFIQKGIKHPGRETNRAKASGRSTHQQMEHDKHSSDPSLRSAANLGLRLTGGDLSPRKKR